MSRISQQELDKMKHLISFGASDTVSVVNNKPIVEYQLKAANGKTYGIIRENNKYYIKEAPKKNTKVLAEDFQYIGGINSKKENEYKSYALAAKQFDLKLMSINEACAAKNRTFIETPKIVDADWQIAETKEMRQELDRIKQISQNVDTLLSENNVIGGFTQKHTLPEAPATNPSQKSVLAPYTEVSIVNGDKDFNKKSKNHEKEGKPFEKDGEVNSDDMKSDKNKKKNTDAKYSEKAKYVPDNSVASQKPRGAKAVKMNEDTSFEDDMLEDDDNSRNEENAVEREKVAEKFENIIRSGRSPIFTFDDNENDYVYFEYDKDNNMMYAGGMCNVGMTHDYEMEYDLNFTIDENLDAFYNKIYEIKLANGDFDDVNESKNKNRHNVKLTLEQAIAWGEETGLINEGSMPLCSDSETNDDYIDMLEDDEHELPFPDADDVGIDDYESGTIDNDDDYIEIELDDDNVNEAYTLTDFGKHPSYRKSPFTTPVNKEVSKIGRDWNDDSAKGNEPFGKKIGSSAPYDELINMLTDAVMDKIDLDTLKKKS